MTNVGDIIKIISMKGEPQYTGALGKVTHIDDIGQIHGTWGGCALIDGVDDYVVVKSDDNDIIKDNWKIKGLAE